MPEQVSSISHELKPLDGDVVKIMNTTSLKTQDEIRVNILPSDERTRRLTPRHYKIIELSLLGTPMTQIATECGCAVRTVEFVLRSPVVQHELARRRAKVDAQVDLTYAEHISEAKALVEMASTEAAEKLVSLIHSENENIALKTSLAIIDRTFGTSKEQQQVQNVTVNVSKLDLLIQAMNESRGE
jgi:hypothetical protein